MIKPEELRIGDIVRVSRDCMFPKGTMCVVFFIREDVFYKNQKEGILMLSAANGDGPWGVYCGNVEGISVTPEILNKNGFKEEIVGRYYTKSLGNEESSLTRFLAVERKRGYWTVFIKYRGLHEYVLLRKIKHVHELQHILWVLGLSAELKIK